jgi:hypothetical protein
MENEYYLSGKIDCWDKFTLTELSWWRKEEFPLTELSWWRKEEFPLTELSWWRNEQFTLKVEKRRMNLYLFGTMGSISC